MKNVLILIAFITLPVLTFGQNAATDTKTQNDLITIEAVTIDKITENLIDLVAFTQNDVVNLSYKKSNDLISIKAYRKSLQIRTKEVKTC